MGFLKRIFSGGSSEPSGYEQPVNSTYPETYDEVMRLLSSYYQQRRPMDFFFEMFILDVLQQLPQSSKMALEEFSVRHRTFFLDHGGSWPKAVIASLHLSDTIDVAIWDLWLKNLENARQKEWTFHPREYAANFVENYLKDHSKIDVWTEESLAQARLRMQQAQGLTR